MDTFRKIAMWGSLATGACITAFGLWQVSRVTWAMLNPPSPGIVFEPVIPLLVGVVIAFVGIAIVAAGRFVKRGRWR